MNQPPLIDHIIAAGSIILLGAIFLRSWGYLPLRQPPPPGTAPIPEDNLYRQLRYINERILGMKYTSEASYIQTLINHVAKIFHDDPEINDIVDELQDALQSQVNYLDVMALQKVG